MNRKRLLELTITAIEDIIKEGPIDDRYPICDNILEIVSNDEVYIELSNAFDKFGYMKKWPIGENDFIQNTASNPNIGVEVFLKNENNLWVGKQLELRTKLMNQLVTHFKEELKPFLKSDFIEWHTQWKADTRYISSHEDIINHNGFKKIVETGYPMIPFIIEELKKQGSVGLLMMLHLITNEKVISDEDAGYLKRQADKWITWAENNGYTTKEN